MHISPDFIKTSDHKFKSGLYCRLSLY